MRRDERPGPRYSLVIDGVVHQGYPVANGGIEFALAGREVAAGWYAAHIAAEDGPVDVHASFDFGDGLRWSQGVDSARRRLTRPWGDIWMVRRSLRRVRLESRATAARHQSMELRLERLGRTRALMMLLVDCLLFGRTPPLADIAGMLAVKGTSGLADALYRYWRGEAKLFASSPDTGQSGNSRPVHAVEKAPLQFSVLLPTYNTNEDALRRCLDSVIAQDYENWQLCVCDDASTRPEVWGTLQEYAAQDPRLGLVRNEHSAHISGATNRALELAKGAFVVFLDHDDELHPEALSTLAQAITEEPEWDLIYTDEDKLGLNGRRFDPYYKPDFNLDLLRAQNCVGHLSACRRELLVQLGGLREGFEGSQDWDLALRVVDACGGERIGHVPKVLYHWRISATSTALSSDAKPYTRSSARRALEEHLQRNSVSAEVTQLAGLPGRFRVIFPLPEDGTCVDVIVVGGRDTKEMDGTFSLLSSLSPVGSRLRFRVRVACRSAEEHNLVVSELGLEAAENCIVDVPEGAWSDIVNHALIQTDGDYLILLPTGLVGCFEDWSEDLLRQSARSDVGLVSPKIYSSEGRIWSCGLIPNRAGGGCRVYQGKPAQFLGMGERAMLAQNASTVGDCVALRRARFDELGGFAPGLGSEAACIDLSLRAAERGWLNVWTPFSEMRWTGPPSPSPMTSVDRKHLSSRWAGVIDLDGDTAFSS